VEKKRTTALQFQKPVLYLRSQSKRKRSLKSKSKGFKQLKTKADVMSAPTIQSVLIHSGPIVEQTLDNLGQQEVQKHSPKPNKSL
jgi:hypothetical protein